VTGHSSGKFERKDKQIPTKKKIKDCPVVKSIAVSLVLIGAKLMGLPMRSIRPVEGMIFEKKIERFFLERFFLERNYYPRKDFSGSNACRF